MLVIAAVRTAEPWSGGNVIGGLLLLAAVALAAVWAVRRFLDR